MIRLAAAMLLCGFAVSFLAGAGCSGNDTETPQLLTTPPAPAARKSSESGEKTELATFGAGCFWGVESTFKKVPGVLDTQVGYAGGSTERPTYEQICYDKTGHAEVVQVEFDPSRVSYQALLEVFFENHDPTTLNRQGPDIGDQYRSVVFFHSSEQEALAQAEKDRRNRSGEYKRLIVTTVQPAPAFWPGESYHQDYFQKAGVNWVCHTGNGKKHKPFR